MSKYANCHIKEISVKARSFGTNVKSHTDLTFYPRYVVLPIEGLPCYPSGKCTECMDDEDFEDSD